MQLPRLRGDTTDRQPGLADGPPRVVLIVPDLSGGGAERAALTVAARSRLRCRVLAESTGGELVDEDRAASVRFVSGHARRPARPLRVARLARVLADERADVAVSFLSPLVHHLASRLAHIPIIHWLRAMPSTSLPLEGPGPYTAANRWVLRELLERAEAVACVSPGIRRDLARLGMDTAAIELLPGPLDLDRIGDRVDRAPHLPIRLITVARLAPPKRHDILLDALRQLRHDVRLTIVGEGSLRPDLERQVRQLELDERVQLKGWVDDPIPLIERSDVFVLSTDTEGLPTALIEAMACGLPVVASDIPHGLDFLLDETTAGIVARRGSAGALAEAIASVIEHAPPTPEARAKAQDRAREFAADVVVPKFDQLVSHVANRSQPR